jgi:hypothetical protein
MVVELTACRYGRKVVFWLSKATHMLLDDLAAVATVDD